MSQEEEKKLYEMKLHECIKSDKCGGVWITRVPGGWIYMDIINETPASVFVPFNNEFMETNQ